MLRSHPTIFRPAVDDHPLRKVTRADASAVTGDVLGRNLVGAIYSVVGG